MPDKWIWRKEREEHKRKAGREEKKVHAVKISCLESTEGGRNGQKQRKECLEGKVLATLCFISFFAFAPKSFVGQIHQEQAIGEGTFKGTLFIPLTYKMRAPPGVDATPLTGLV